MTAAAALLALLPAAALATNADDLCARNADPCLVTRSVAVTPGSIIDVGARVLRVTGSGELDLSSGTMTLRAGELQVLSGGRLLADGAAALPGGRIIVTAGSITTAGSIDVSGAPGGTVILTATGPLTVTGQIDARSMARDSGGGKVSLEGVQVALSSQLTVLGGTEAFGGDVAVRAGVSLAFGGTIVASGGDGGAVDLASAGVLSVSALATIRANATASGGAGGEAALTAAGALTVDGELAASGRNGTVDDGGGDGGTVSLSGASVMLAGGARLLATAGGPDGLGGDIDVSAVVGGLELRGRIDAAAQGSDGNGGNVTLKAVGDATLHAVVGAGGGSDGGGDIDIAAGGALTLVPTASLDATGSGTGEGGAVTLDGGSEVLVQGAALADSGGGAGSGGGSILARACLVRIAAGGRLSALRAQGDVVLIGRDRSIIAGILRADTASGLNQVRYAGPGHEPQIVAGASIQPPLTSVIDASVQPCIPDPTATVTRTGTETATATPTGQATATVTATAIDSATPSPGTPSASPSPTPTPTAIAQPCVGDCAGDAMVSVADLITCVNVALGAQPVSICPACDPGGDGMVSVSDLIQGVNNALNGCPAA